MQSLTIPTNAATAPTYGREPYIVAQAATAPPVFTDDGRVHLGPFVDRYLCDADARTKDAGLAKMAGLANAASLTAQARAAFPRIVIEEVTLDQGIPAMFRDLENGVWRFAYDPAQCSRAKVEGLINIYIAGSDQYVEYTVPAYQALRGLNGFRAADPDPKVIAFWDEVEQQVIAAADPKACVARIYEAITRERAARDAR